MAVCTKLSVKEIQLALRDSFLFDTRSDIVVPNVSWGLLPYEADLLGINKGGQCTEVEIKRSFEDFKADFKKWHKHDAQQITYFYYAVPEAIVDKVKNFLLDLNEITDTSVPGYSKKLPCVLYYTEKGEIHIAREVDNTTAFGTARRFGYHKISEEDKATVGRLGTLRYWDVQRDLFETGLPSKKDIKIHDLNQINEELRGTLKRWKRENRAYDWMPCVRELPNTDREVMTTNGFDKYRILFYENNEWKDPYDDGKPIHRYVAAWQELPSYDYNDVYNKSKKK